MDIVPREFNGFAEIYSEFSDLISMIVFHGGGAIPIYEPDTRHNSGNTDFGDGFYTTYNPDQAEEWSWLRYGEDGIVNVYLYDNDKCAEYDFAEPSKEWLDFVAANRKGLYSGYDQYDVIVGPVADDDVYDTVQSYVDGCIDVEETLKQLEIMETYDQAVFKNDSAIQRGLTFLGWFK